MNNTQIIQPVKIRVTGRHTLATATSTKQVANIAQALLNAAGDNDTRRGVALLAQALGCEVKEVTQ